MENNNNRLERRAYERFDVGLEFKLKGIDFHLTAETKNLSGSGLYCQVDRFIPMMTKLALTMFVPGINNGEKAEKEINCVAVVIRIMPETEQESLDRYNIGLFFIEIADKDRDWLLTYMRQAFCAGNN
ncbi:MAG: PilZ domain-containing protein [PVC group bacterium]|nr:PilZ domain-containing protein [PVC group bacterium]